MKHVLVLNGPNLGQLGSRQPAVYGTGTFADLVGACTATAAELNLSVEVRQTDDEATMLGWLHGAIDEAAAVVLNSAAWTHYSYALQDAVGMVTTAGVPVIEVHLTNPWAREAFRHVDVVAGVATGVIAGFGFDSYRLGLRAVAELVSAEPAAPPAG